MGVPWNPLCPRGTKTGWTQRLYLSKGGPWVSHGIPCVPGTLRRDGHRDYTFVKGTMGVPWNPLCPRDTETGWTQRLYLCKGDHGRPMESLVSQGH